MHVDEVEWVDDIYIVGFLSENESLLFISLLISPHMHGWEIKLFIPQMEPIAL